jgi:hypothetical protein
MRRTLSAAAVAACALAVIAAPGSAAAATAGPSWSVVPTPSPAGASASELGGVACSGAGACTAVGDSGSSPDLAALAERWDGTAFTIQPVPSPASSQSTELGGVSCPAATACTAVGSYRVPSPGGYPTTHSLAERWDGTAWSIQPTPDLQGGLAAVSCPTVSDCTAVGARAEQWNGSAWSGETLPIPHGAVNVFLFGVSCTAASACIAVGSYSVQGSPGDHPLAEQWNGSAWSTQPMPTPPGAGDASLNAVSCPAAAAPPRT